jgi:hypothetical protein
LNGRDWKDCWYVARPEVSSKRLSKTEDGSILLELKTAYKDGTTHLKFAPDEFIRKLIPLVPPPRSNLTRYHGAFGPHSKLRKKVVARNKKPTKKKEKTPVYKIRWARLLKRVFGFEVENCRCGGRYKITSAILDQGTAVKIMKSLDIEVFIPDPAPSNSLYLFDSS